MVWLWLLTFPAVLSAQKKMRGENLVQNSSFEEIVTNKTVDQNSSIDVAVGWSAPNKGESLLYTTRGEHIYDPHGGAWPFRARTGKNVAGMNVYGGTDEEPSREYIQGTLTRPLTKGKKYLFEFWVHYHCEGANNIGIAFLPGKVNAPGSGLLEFQPVSHQMKVTPYNRNTWTLVRDSFYAVMPYQNFIIGNFFPDSLTEIEDNGFSHHFAYIDDIMVVEAPDQPGLPQLVSQTDEKKWAGNAEKFKVLPGELTAAAPEEASKIFFDFDSDVITAEAASVLDNFAARVGPDRSAKLTLKGFASSEGSEAYNLQLSKRRAASVRRYLKQKGVSVTSISIRSFGEAHPEAPNDTEENRSRNRRVELSW